MSSYVSSFVAHLFLSDVAADDLLLFDCSLFAFFIVALLSPTATAVAIAAQCSASDEVMGMTVLITILGMVAIKRIKNQSPLGDLNRFLKISPQYREFCGNRRRDIIV